MSMDVNRQSVNRSGKADSPPLSIERHYDALNSPSKDTRIAAKRLKAASKVQFIPFFQERDHLGRLLKIKEEKNDIQLSPDVTKSIISPSHSISEKPLNLKHSYHLDGVRMFGNQLNWDEIHEKYRDQPSIRAENVNNNLFSILPVEENSFVVSPSHRQSQDYTKIDTKKGSLDNSKNPLGQLLSNTTSPRSSQPHLFGRKLPSLQGSISVSSHKREIDYIQENTFDSHHHLSNETVWKYQMTQDELNKKIMRPEVFWKTKAKPRELRLIKPKRSEIPSIGLYVPYTSKKKSPSHKFSVVVKKNNIGKAPPPPESISPSQLLDEHKLRDPKEETLRMIKEMLAEADRGLVARQKQREDENKAYTDILPLYKKLSYVTVDNFEQFPDDFGQKMTHLRNRIRKLKNNIHDDGVRAFI